MFNNSNNKDIIKAQWVNHLNYSYLFPFFLKYNALVMALASLKVAMKNINPLFNLDNFIKQNQEFSSSANSIIKEVSNCSTLMENMVFNQINFFNNNNNDNSVNEINMNNIQNNIHVNNESNITNNTNINENFNQSNFNQESIKINDDCCNKNK